MKKILFVLSLAINLFFSSCSLMYVANPGIEPVVFTKPMHRDTAFTSNYVGAKYSHTLYDGMYEFNDLSVNNMAQAYFYQTYTRKLLNASYGTFGYLGNIGVIPGSGVTEYKNYFGLGGTTDVQVNVSMGRFALRPIGCRFSLLYENGEFAKYKRDVIPYIGAVNNSFSSSLSQTFGAEYYFKKSSLAFNLSVGVETTLPLMVFDVGYSSNLIYTTNKLSIYLQNTGLAFLHSNEVSVGVSYRLPDVK